MRDEGEGVNGETKCGGGRRGEIGGKEELGEKGRWEREMRCRS